jgi:uncharacterized integral membrane protein
MKKEGRRSLTSSSNMEASSIPEKKGVSSRTRNRPIPHWIPQAVFWFYHSVVVYMISVTISKEESVFRFAWMTMVAIFVFYGVYGNKEYNPFKNFKTSKYLVRVVLVLLIAMFVRYQTEFGVFQMFSVADKVPPSLRNFLFVVVPVFLIAGMAYFVRFLDHRTALELELFIQLEDSSSESDTIKQPESSNFLQHVKDSINSLKATPSSGKAEYMQTFSNLLQYTLHESSKPLVPAEQEITAMKNFISLHQMKSEYPLRIDFSLSGAIFLAQIQIIPVLGIFLLENAFEQSGITHNRASWVKVEIQCSASMMTMSISNNCEENLPEHESFSGAIYKELHRQLNLRYPEKFQLDCMQLPDSCRQILQGFHT